MSKNELIPLVEGWVVGCKYPEYAYKYHVRGMEGSIYMVSVEQRADWIGYLDEVGVHFYIDLVASSKTKATKNKRMKQYTLHMGHGWHKSDFLILARACLTGHVPAVEVLSVPE